MITINGVSFPKPACQPLENDTEYWIVNLFDDNYSRKQSHSWQNYNFDNHWLRRGLIHLSRENAITHAKALIKLGGGNIDE